jgi:hypothetical protein
VTWVIWNPVSVCLVIVFVSVQHRCMVCAKHTEAQKSFSTHPMVLLGDGLMWKLVSVCMEIVLILMQDRCTICTERTIGSEIVLDEPNGTPR